MNESTVAHLREVVDETADELERLTAVALAARALVRSASGNALLRDEDTVSEPALTALESALAEAGYDMTDEELVAAEESRDGL